MKPEHQGRQETLRKFTPLLSELRVATTQPRAGHPTVVNKKHHFVLEQGQNSRDVNSLHFL